MDIIDLDQPLTLEKLKEIITTENINSKGIDFNTPLLSICKRKDVQLEHVKYLVETGANIHEYNCHHMSALHILCLNSANLDIIKYFVELDKYIIYKTCVHNNVAIEYICMYNNCRLDIIKYLVELDIKQLDGFNGNRVIHRVCSNTKISTDQKLEIINYLKKYLTEFQIDYTLNIIRKMKKIIPDLDDIIQELETLPFHTKSAAKIP